MHDIVFGCYFFAIVRRRLVRRSLVYPVRRTAERINERNEIDVISGHREPANHVSGSSGLSSGRSAIYLHSSVGPLVERHESRGRAAGGPYASGIPGRDDSAVRTRGFVFLARDRRPPAALARIESESERRPVDGP